MRILALITEAAPIGRILSYIGEPPQPITPARGSPAWNQNFEPMPEWDLLGQPTPEFEFDQRIAWQ